MKKKNIIWIIVGCVVFSTAYVLADYFNIPVLVGFDSSQINWDIASLIIGNVVVVGLYLLTYVAIDKRNVAKERNLRDVAELTLLSTYDSCIESVDLFNDNFVARNAARKCDFDKLEFQDPIMQQYLNLPFVHHNDIVDFAKSGIITADEYRNYLDIRKLYMSHIRVRLAFFDQDTYKQYKKEEIKKAVEKGRNLIIEDRKQ